MKVGILGGSFNPIHLGHLKIAEQAQACLQLDRVIFVPAGDPPHKEPTELALACDRFEMVKLAIRGNPRFEVSDVEIWRPGKSYTIDTVKELQLQLGPRVKLYFIIGADTIKELPTWKDVAELVQLVQFVTVARAGFGRQDLEVLKGTVSGPALENMRATYLDIAPIRISASRIRQMMRAGFSISNLVDAEVDAYIRDRQLYQ